MYCVRIFCAVNGTVEDQGFEEKSHSVDDVTHTHVYFRLEKCVYVCFRVTGFPKVT